MKRIPMILIIMFMASTSLFGQAAWNLDKAHSSIMFTAKHMVISEVVGSFKDFSISLKSDKDDFSDAVVQSTIKVASLSTDNAMRDGHLKSDDFFNAEKFPEINFKSTSFEKLGDNKYKITGDLTIRDVTRNVTFDAVLNGTQKTNRGVMASWKATTTINRFDFNLKWNKALESGGLIVGQDVAIALNLEMNK